ncbi:MAG: hypothetical protein RL186_1482, partial [Pseudomonadota bacterium]
MHPSIHAQENGEKPAIIIASSGAVTTYGALDKASNQVAHLLRAGGLQAGDVIAVLMENGADYFELVWGAQRAGLYFTCISTKLQAGEIAYIL